MTGDRACDPLGAASGRSSPATGPDAGRGDFTVTIYPADRPADVMRAWAALPDGLGFAEAFGDVEVTLVFRPAGNRMSSWEPNGMPAVPD
ncbi:hypothetical protein [Protofrankia symbiont of Coriaria ruscifolia]|uniref:hypothetical protein n=1 Tax=Protofrankia symbiont of Coriaria ruscifolia TaxID=1306542 RepID=UPI001040F637|nr:hypothetical protein [Protofrankia symbiont of Coriaria ruscifolia]